MTLRPFTLEDLRIVHIKNTLELSNLMVSQGCVGELESASGVQVEPDPHVLAFGETGNLISMDFD